MKRYRKVCVGCGVEFMAGKLAKFHDANCRQRHRDRRTRNPDPIEPGRPSRWYWPGQFALWSRVLNAYAERRGVFKVRERGTRRVVFIGRTRSRDLAETIGLHVGERWGDGAKCDPYYIRSRVEVSITWIPGMSHAEAVWRKLVIAMRPRDVPGDQIAEAARIINRVRRHDWREPKRDADPMANDRHKPRIDAVSVPEDQQPVGVPDRLESLVGRLTVDVGYDTPPGAVVIAEHVQHDTGESVYRLGRLLVNAPISKVHFFDVGRPVAVSRGCLSVLLVGGAA